MAEEANLGDRVLAASLVNTGLFYGERFKYCSNIKHIKRCQLKWLKSSENRPI